MAELYEIQPDMDPIEYTHFDSWFEDESDPIAFMFDPSNEEALIDKLKKVIFVWEETLDVGLDGFVGDLFGGSYSAAYKTLGFSSFMNLVVMNLLKAGFDIYMGDEFIEIYKTEEV